MYSGTSLLLCRVRPSLPDGYTLVEVLVALLIFTAMGTLAGFALNQGLGQYRGLVEKGLNFWDYAKPIWIDKSFSSAIDYYIHASSKGWFPYFKGDQDGVSYVSTAPFAGDLPVIVWIRKEEKAGGKLSLMYYELPVYTKTFQEIERDEIFKNYKKGKSFKILEGMDQIALSFYAYDFTRRMYQWYTDFEGSKMKILPSFVKISYARGEEKGTFIFEIKVNSLLKWSYDEVYPK